MSTEQAQREIKAQIVHYKKAARTSSSERLKWFFDGKAEALETVLKMLEATA